MNLERIPVTRLKPAPYNPRRQLRPGDPGYERLKRSLAEFDLVQPIVWNRRTGHVVAGHQRLGILEEQGVNEVDCVVVDLSLAREKALNVALNNPNVGGTWDFDLLGQLVEDLQQSDLDATLTGFSDDELRELLLAPVESSRPEQPARQRRTSAAQTLNVILEVPADRWEFVRSRLDVLLADEPAIVIHVHGAPASTSPPEESHAA